LILINAALWEAGGWLPPNGGNKRRFLGKCFVLAPKTGEHDAGKWRTTSSYTFKVAVALKHNTPI
jgi:hypothetical protein